MVLSHDDYRAGLRRRGVPFDVHPGYDHEGLNAALEIALPAATDWLLRQADALGRRQSQRRTRRV
jgi:hypothetical protein